MLHKATLIFALLGSFGVSADNLIVTFALRSPEYGWSILHQRKIERDEKTVKFLKGPYSGDVANNASFEKGNTVQLLNQLEIDKKGRVKLLGIPLLQDLWTDKQVIWSEYSYKIFSDLFEGEGDYAQIFSKNGGDVVIENGKLKITEGDHTIYAIARNSIGCIGGYLGDGQFGGSPGGAYVTWAPEILATK